MDTITPRMAYDQYTASERIACERYSKYWVDKLLQAGINGVVDVYGGISFQFRQYNGNFYVAPMRFEGLKIRVECRSQWTYVKIKSDTGFNKFINRLRNGGY
jgi:hypothetical protein